MSEIRAVRESYAEKFGGDIKAMMNDMQKRQDIEGRKVVSRPAKRIAELPVSHVMYHDGQLNYIQTLHGDDQMHL